MSDPSSAPAGAAVRKIIHIDMDAFFASVEQRDDPSLRGLPVAVGGSRERGVVAAASYEARRFGVRSAMASAAARRLCPDLVFVKPRFEIYKAVSRQIRTIFADYTDLVEPLSLDEAYLDVTSNARGESVASRLAEEIRARIRDETGLTASAGVSYNKFLAKIASDQRKPDGLFVITPRQGPAFVEALDIARFHGIGPKTAARMRALGIATGRDLKACPEPMLLHHFGKAGAYYFRVARGIDTRPVSPDRIRKSVGSETTFPVDLDTIEALQEALAPLARSVARHAETSGLAGRTVTLKVKYTDFRIVTRRRTGAEALRSAEDLLRVGCSLLGQIVPLDRPVRLIGITLSSFEAEADAGAQLALAL